MGTTYAAFTVFMANKLITAFNEFRHFTTCSIIAGNHARYGDNSGFAYCSNLKEITLPGSLREIGDHAFNGCSNITVLDIPVAVARLGLYSIRDAARVIICRPTSPPTLGSYNNSGTAVIYVPDDSVSAYKSSSNWSVAQIANRIHPLSEYED